MTPLANGLRVNPNHATETKWAMVTMSIFRRIEKIAANKRNARRYRDGSQEHQAVVEAGHRLRVELLALIDQLCSEVGHERSH